MGDILPSNKVRLLSLVHSRNLFFDGRKKNLDNKLYCIMIVIIELGIVGMRNYKQAALKTLREYCIDNHYKLTPVRIYCVTKPGTPELCQIVIPRPSKNHCLRYRHRELYCNLAGSIKRRTLELMRCDPDNGVTHWSPGRENQLREKYFKKG